MSNTSQSKNINEHENSSHKLQQELEEVRKQQKIKYEQEKHKNELVQNKTTTLGHHENSQLSEDEILAKNLQLQLDKEAQEQQNILPQLPTRNERTQQVLPTTPLHTPQQTRVEDTSGDEEFARRLQLDDDDEDISPTAGNLNSDQDRLNTRSPGLAFMDSVFRMFPEHMRTQSPFLSSPNYFDNDEDDDPFHSSMQFPSTFPPVLLTFFRGMNLPEHLHGNQQQMSYEDMLTLAERLGPAINKGATKESISRLPTFQFKAENASSKNKTCLVCMEDFKENETVKTLPCMHQFHSPNCIDKWLQINKTCPI